MRDDVELVPLASQELSQREVWHVHAARGNEVARNDCKRPQHVNTAALASEGWRRIELAASPWKLPSKTAKFSTLAAAASP